MAKKITARVNKGDIEYLKGDLEPLNLEGGEEPMVQIINKLNEVISKVNGK